MKCIKEKEVANLTARIEKLETTVADLMPYELEEEEPAATTFKPGDTVHTPKGIGIIHSIARDCGKNIFVTFNSDDSRESFLAEDCWLVSTAKFVECSICAAKPGMPVLCPSCLHNRTAIGRLTPPLLSPKQQEPGKQKQFKLNEKVMVEGLGECQITSHFVNDSGLRSVATIKGWRTHLVPPADISTMPPEKTTGLTWKEAEAWMDREERVRKPCYSDQAYTAKVNGGTCHCGIDPNGMPFVHPVDSAVWKDDGSTDWEVMT